MAYDDDYFHKNSPPAGSHFNGTRFRLLQDLADQNGGLYDLAFNGDQKYRAYLECIATNPTCTWNPVNQLIVRVFLFESISMFHADDVTASFQFIAADAYTCTLPLIQALQYFF